MRVLLFLMLTTAAGAKVAVADEEHLTQSKYAFNDQWNLRIETSIDSFWLISRESRGAEGDGERFTGNRNLLDINYGPIGLFGARSNVAGQFSSSYDYSFRNNLVIDEAGMFFEVKPFRSSESQEKQGLAFGLRASVLSVKQGIELYDKYNSIESITTSNGARCGLLARFYTISDFYFSVQLDFLAVKIKHDKFRIDTINLYRSQSAGVGYAF